MPTLSEIAAYSNEYLRVAEIPDFSGAINGIQLENQGDIRKIVAAVDSHEPTIAKAIEAEADLLLVHHGLFWQGAQPFTGALYRKIRAAMENNLAILSYHHPLDAHPELGNNILLARALGLNSDPAPFFPYKGVPIGLRFSGKWDRTELQEKLSQAVGGAVQLSPGGPEVVRELGICTGGAGGEVADAQAAGIDTFLTGEGPHWSYTLAEELGLNLFYGGHYATETFGVKAMAEHLSQEFGLEDPAFVHHPTGL